MKSVWDGSIAFGLVNIPVKLYSAVESQALNFRLLHDKDKEPIQYKRWCPKCKKEIPWKHIVKGIELKKGKYYVLSKDELKKIKPKRTDTIEIIEFVDKGQIDPIYFDTHYYVAPQKAKEKAYFLFREVLQATNKAAIGRFVMREKEHVCAIESYRQGLLLTTLNYAYEIRNINKIPELRQAPKLKKQEFELAKKLIQKLYREEFQISKFKDTFADELKKILIKKAAGKPVKLAAKPRKKKPKQLMQALKASLK